MLQERYREESGTKTVPTVIFSTLGSWSSRFRWQDRTSRMQEIINEEDERAFQKARREVRLNAIEDYDKLREMALEILARSPDFFKTTTQTVQGKWEKVEGKDGKTYHVQLTPDREIIRVALDGRLALQAIKLATEICREAVVMPEFQAPLVQINQNTLTQNVFQAKIEQLPEGNRDNFISLMLQAERAMVVDLEPEQSGV